MRLEEKNTTTADPMKLQLHLLNPQQRAAVEQVEGPLLILAGAGSGKTRVITHRVGYLLLQGVEPESILAVSFTNKAAAEMRERVGELVGGKLADRVYLSTFHSLGADILRSHIHHLGYRRPFSILDQADQRGVMRDLLRELGINTKEVDPKQVLFLISRAKMAFTEPAQLEGFRFNPMMPFAQRAFSLYQNALKGLNAVDFDDLIALPVTLFKEHPKVRAHYANRFQYVMIDEYQDTNHTQWAFVYEMIREHQNLCVVGDDDQSIYAFRGAVAGNILGFENQLPNARTIKLEQNYRSTNAILKSANTLIANNTLRKAKNLWSDQGDGEHVRVTVCEDAREEAEFVAAEIAHLAGESSLSFREIGVLYRVNPQSRIFEEAFRAMEIPYRIVGGTEFFDRREVRDALAYLRVLANERDEISLRRIVNVPGRGIGPTTLARMSALADAQRTSFRETIARIASGEATIEKMTLPAVQHLQRFDDILKRYRRTLLDKTEDLHTTCRNLFEEIHFFQHLLGSDQNPLVARMRTENVEDLFQSIREFGGSGMPALEAYLERVTLDRTPAKGTSDDRQNAVQMMTIHSSKGLEFPAVFLVGFEEGMLPHSRSLKEQGGISEERRLAYVGITRAKKHLTISHALVRSRFGKDVECTPSRFLDELPTEVVTREGAAAHSQLREFRDARNQEYLQALRSVIFDS